MYVRVRAAAHDQRKERTLIADPQHTSSEETLSRSGVAWPKSRSTPTKADPAPYPFRDFRFGEWHEN